MRFIKQLSKIRIRLIPKHAGQTPVQTAVVAICLIGICLLSAIVISNFILGLYEVALLFIPIIIILFFLYYLSRYKKRYGLVTVCFSILCYTALIINYFLNYGMEGPTILGFFVSFLLLIAIIHKKYHFFVGLLHTSILSLLFLIEYIKPSWFTGHYASFSVCLIDWLVAYMICLVFTYFIINFLRNIYLREKKLAEKRARAIERNNARLKVLVEERNKLLSMIAHDLRSPLAVIEGYLELISDSSVGQEDDMKNDLLDLTKRTSDMLLNMVNWSKGQMEGMNIHLQPFNIYDLIMDKILLYHSIAEHKDIVLEYTGSRDISVMADADMTKMILRNLISNAIKFTPRGGHIGIRTETKNGSCMIRVSDTGIGMTAEAIHKLFSFKTVSTYGTENEKGVGLGLALCKDFATMQKGDISVQSRPHEGTTFTLSLPLAM